VPPDESGLIDGMQSLFDTGWHAKGGLPAPIPRSKLNNFFLDTMIPNVLGDLLLAEIGD